MKKEHGNIAPALVAKGEEIVDSSIDVPYQLVTILRKLYPWLPKDKRIAIVARRCDEKALNELIKRELIDPKRIEKIGLACSQEQIAKCRCSDPVPSKVDIGQPGRAVDPSKAFGSFTDMPVDKKMEFWVRQFRKCNKCFACTTNCPVCFCDDCVLEEKTFVSEKGIPPGLSFHLVRSFHLADKCVECGECERSCPADIPLLTLRKLILSDMKELFGFSTGNEKVVSPLLTTLEGEPLEDDKNVC